MICDVGLQGLACDCCGEVVELMKTVWNDPRERAMAKQEMAAEHRDCEAYRGRPEMARAARNLNAGLKREFAQLEQGGRTRRCRKSN